MTETFTIKQDRERFGVLRSFELMPEEFAVDGLTIGQAQHLARSLGCLGVAEGECAEYYRVLPAAVRRKAGPYTTEEFFHGALNAVDYMRKTADQTQGAGVWQAMLESMRRVLITDAKEKGFYFK